MNESVLTIEDAAARLPEVVERVYGKGESAVLVKAGRPMARIVPVPSAELAADDLAAFLRRWRVEHPEPDNGFADAIEESCRSVWSKLADVAQPR
jgi:prevent-host-death family protein